MSTVSNPYTFNIKSNCGVSTNPLLSNNQAKITMKYYSSDKIDTPEDPDYPENPELWPTYYYTVETLEYDSSDNTGSIVPSVVNGNTIYRVRCTNTYGDYNGSVCLIFIKTSHQQYSKIILNGGPFKNCSIPYVGYTPSTGVQRYYIESGESITGVDYKDWEKYNNIPFDLTIKFIE